MNSSFNRAITILSLMVAGFCTFIIGCCSLVIGSITVTDEVPLTRTASLQSGTRVASFRDAVRERDKRCVITRRPARLAHLGKWTNFEAAHVFPIAYEGYWDNCNYRRWITIPPANESHGSINSVQNGILLAKEIHDCFNSYDLTINPDV